VALEQQPAGAERELAAALASRSWQRSGPGSRTPRQSIENVAFVVLLM
jgi:hypothetical protein